MKKLKALQRLRCDGVPVNQGKQFEASDPDARVLVATKQAEYVDKKDVPVQKGLTAESLKQK